MVLPQMCLCWDLHLARSSTMLKCNHGQGSSDTAFLKQTSCQKQPVLVACVLFFWIPCLHMLPNYYSREHWW